MKIKEMIEKSIISLKNQEFDERSIKQRKLVDAIIFWLSDVQIGAEMSLIYEDEKFDFDHPGLVNYCIRIKNFDVVLIREVLDEINQTKLFEVEYEFIGLDYVIKSTWFGLGSKLVKIEPYFKIKKIK